MADKFIHLHTHSHYSLLNALPKVDELVKRAKKLGMSAIALTDNGNLYGAIEFYKVCKKNEIKPILGIDAYVAARGRKDMQAGIDSKRYRLVLLAKNAEGYKNLMKLVTFSHLEGFYYKPRIDKELMKEYSKDLICIAPSFSSEITQALKARDAKKAKEKIESYKEIYGAENFYIEITHHPEIDNHESLMKSLIDLARETQTQIVAGHDVYYLDPEDRVARNTLMMVNTHGDMSDRNSENDEEDFSFLTPDSAVEAFKDTPDALENTVKIAGECDLKIELGKWIFPDYKVESGLSYDDELKKLAYLGIPDRGMKEEPRVIERLEYELKVIKDKGYAKYFLVVADLLRFAHEHKILTNIRGSVAGSLTTYLTRITNVDPLAYKLPFERFLNPERPSAPDIDMDFADIHRDEVIEYARSKYGKDKVAQIGTFGTMMARGAVRDVARALGYPYDIGDRISKMIPMGAQGFPMTIDRAMEEVPELKAIYEKEEDTKRIIDLAKKIEGCARHISVHAAGVVISPDPLIEHVPLQYDTKGENKIITQYDMHGVGEDGVGLLKFDFLGIRNLSILADAVERVKKVENKDVDIENIPLDDALTFENLAKGETIGLFQLNGTGMTKFLKDLKPSSIHDINAMVALYRPGPLESIPQYIERKHNPKKIKYLDPRLKDILDMSYGVITYQDDVMMIAIKLAGYSWLEADKLRKAMGKKIPKDMQEQKEKLHAGFIKGGLSEEKAQELWKLIEPFAAYGFNKAHAASYGRVAYQTAYMKANFPAIYMSAILTAESGDVEKIGEIVQECKRMGIPVLPPDVNESYSQFTIIKGIPNSEIEAERKDRIRFGLLTIKNFGQGASTAIIEERKKAGKFKSLTDFLSRVQGKDMNKKSLESLIKAGALDAFGMREQMLNNMEELLRFNKDATKQDKTHSSLFDGLSGHSPHELRLEPTEPIPQEQKLAWEKELLGLYISGHPLDKFRDILDKRELNIAKAKTNLKNNAEVILAGIVDEIKAINTKKGDLMAFIKLTDFTGSIEVVLFPRTYHEARSILLVDKCIVIKGKMSDRKGVMTVIADKIRLL